MFANLPSLLFAAMAMTWTAVLMILYLPLFLLPRRATQFAARLWIRGLVGMLGTIVGLRHEVRGLDNIPAGPVIFASKHQSAWDTLIFHLLFDDPAFILKRELFHVPFFGWYLYKAGMIGINRKAAASALRKMLTAAGKAVSDNRPLVIFPEGTRVAPGVKLDYQPGIAAFYNRLDARVVPVALNSGVFWGRRATRKYPGTIVIEFLPAIETGLDRTSFMARLEESIETATERLKVEGERQIGSLGASPSDGLPPVGRSVGK